jgi:DNA polymerase-4
LQARCRIACLRIPRFPIVVHQRDDASLKGKPFVILAGKGNHAHVVMCSPEAARHQIFAGMKLSEARAVCSDLIWREYDGALYREAQKQLCRKLIACTPKVTALEPGVFLLDAGGLNYLGGEQRFCLAVHKIVGKAGFAYQRIGLADSAFAATVASKVKRKQHYIVKAGDDVAFLAPLSIKHLPISLEMQESLHELGIRSIGQMVSLSAESLGQRFGKEGTIAYELAHGIDRRQPSLPPADKEFKSFVDLGSAIELLHEIQFVLKSMVDRLTRQLKDEGLLAEELLLSFFNDNDKFDERPIKLLRPANNPKFLLEVMKLSLEATPIQREVTAISLVVSCFTKETWDQLEIKRDQQLQVEDAADKTDSLSLTLMLQRFITRLGEDAVVQSIPNDQHIPEHAGAWLPVAGKPAVLPVVPVNIAYVNAKVGPSGLTSGLALRKLAAPKAVLVEFKGDQPAAITFEGRWYRIGQITVPERLSGLWWEQPVRKSYYNALIFPREPNQRAARMHEEPGSIHASADGVDSDRTGGGGCAGLLVLLVHDHEENAWFINGIYD